MYLGEDFKDDISIHLDDFWALVCLLIHNWFRLKMDA